MTSEFRWICMPARSPATLAAASTPGTLSSSGPPPVDERPEVEIELLEVRVAPLLGLLRRERERGELLEGLFADGLDERSGGREGGERLLVEPRRRRGWSRRKSYQSGRIPRPVGCRRDRCWPEADASAADATVFFTDQDRPPR